MSPFDADYRALTETCALVRDPGLVAVELEGADVREWLQGQVTQDVRLLAPDRPLEACLCKPTGQIEALLVLHATERGALVVAHRDELGELLDRVERLVILEDVRMGTPQPVATVQGPLAEGAVAGLRAVPSRRSPSGGWDVLGEPPAIHEAGAEAYRVVLIEGGVPVRGEDYDGRTLPPELGPAFGGRTLSYTKGCYVGQEVLMRIHSRGHTNRTWMALCAEAPVRAGDEVTHPDARRPGVVSSAGISPRLGPIAGVWAPNEMARPGERVLVRSGAGGVPAALADHPLTSGPV